MRRGRHRRPCDMTDSPDIMFTLGRLEGKVDAFMALQKGHSSRLDDLENRQNAADQRLTKIEARGEGSKTWLTQLASWGALIVAAIAAYITYVAN